MTAALRAALRAGWSPVHHPIRFFTRESASFTAWRTHSLYVISPEPSASNSSKSLLIVSAVVFGTSADIPRWNSPQSTVPEWS